MQSRLSSCTIHVTSGLHFTYADTSDCIISYLFLPNTEAHVQYDLEAVTCTIQILEPHILQYLVLGEFRSLLT